MNEKPMQMHSAVGTGAGMVRHGKRDVPVVTLHFAKDVETIRRLEAQEIEFNPEDQRLWSSYALSIRAARQLIGDLNEAIDSAVRGPRA